jgi:Omp85 superfamily domain
VIHRIVALASLALAPQWACTEEILETSLPPADARISLPYAFWNETFGFAAGYVYAVNGSPQPQAGMVASIMAGTEGSLMGFAMGQNIRPFRSLPRLLVDPIFSLGYYDNADVFIDGNPDFPDERAGSNDSDAEDFITGSGRDSFARARFKYVLPIGTGRERILPAFQFDGGLLVDGANGGGAFNPWKSGMTYVEVMPFYRSQNVENDQFDIDQATNGLELGLFYDNRDIGSNPSRGESVRLRVAHDWGLLDSTDTWTSVGAEADHYVSLGETDRFRQRVLALNVWTSYSPTWEVNADGLVDNRPPAFSGATLGGLWRMRAFPAQRFNDKAGIYYAAELRLVPEWNPMVNFPALQQRVGIQWFQVVPFAEVGRVAPHWRIEELHRDMQWSVGCGVRAWAQGLVGRVDVAFSNEGFGVQMMVGQPFQF